QCDEPLAMRQHRVLARTHVLDDAQLRQLRVTPLELHHELRHETEHLAAARQRAVRERAHRAGRAAAVDDRVALVHEDFADAARRVVVDGRAPLARRAIYANASFGRDLLHSAFPARLPDEAAYD